MSDSFVIGNFQAGAVLSQKDSARPVGQISAK